MIKANTNYDVAVINYPLMDPRIIPKDHGKYINLDDMSVDPWNVPVYIHIPFCSSVCKFCVYSRQIPDSKKILDDYVEALKREISLYGKTPYIQSLNINSIFMGGGTPTTLSSLQLKEIISTLNDYLPIKDPELTVECNISNADEKKISALYEAGVTRISTGFQTFSQERRDVLGLRNTADDLINWLDMVRKYPFKDVSIDLLYGLPGQTLLEWENDIHTAVSLPVDHFSIYKLTVFAYVKLYKELENHTVPELPKEEQVFEMYMEANKILKSKGLIVQSSQEYCRKDNISRFWDQTYDGYGDNLSFGTFSFGYINGVSYQNMPNPKDYIAAISENKFPIKMVSQKITTEQLLERTVMLSFRRGYIDKSLFYQQYGQDMDDVFGDILEALQNQGYISEKDGRYELTSIGRYYQGNVSVKFMRSTFDKVSSLKKKMAIGMHVVPEVLKDIREEQE